MTNRCCHLTLWILIFGISLFFGFFFTAAQSLALPEKSSDLDIESLEHLVRSSRRKPCIKKNRCIYINNSKCLNNCNKDLIRIMTPEKKFKQVEVIIDDKSFEKPNECTREYRYLRLSNSLNVFMIYDKTTDVSFGNMLLDLGFSSDPENIPGLSRYLLYTILLGSLNKKFFRPFSSLIKKFKGGFGANISRDYSRYGFSINSSEFEIALKIFAKMFINLNTNDDVHEEILTAFSSDLSYRLNMDSFRLSDVLYEIVTPRGTEGSSNDCNPMEYMNIHQLGQLKSKKILLEFFNQYYRADRMTLTILSNKTLDEQTSLVRKYFNKIRGGDTNIVTRLRLPDSSMKHPLYGSMGKILVFRSLRGSSLLKLIFPLDDIIKPRLSSKPMFFFSMYISSKRKGSLYYYFYKRELITELNISLSNSIFGYYSLIIDITLQKAGELNIIHIIQGIFSVFEMMRNTKPKLDIYNQVKALKMRRFKHRSNNSLFDECSNIQNSFYFLKCPPEKVLSATSTYTDYNLELHYKILSALRPENMLLVKTFRSNEFDSLVEATKGWPNGTTEHHAMEPHQNSSTCNSTQNPDTSGSVYGSESLLGNNIQSLRRTEYFRRPDTLKWFNYSLFFETSLNESEVVTSNFTRTKYIIKKISPILISHLTDSINPFTAVNKFEIYDPDNKFLRVKEPRSYLVGVEKQDVPIRLVDAIRNLKSKRYNKILAQDVLKDYQPIFYLPQHLENALKSSISITISLPPKLFSDKLPYSPAKLEVIFSAISFMLMRSFEDIKYYYRKMSTELSFSMNTPRIRSYYTYGLIVELTGITDNLPHAISTIASRIREFPSAVKDFDLNTAKEYCFKYMLYGNVDNLPHVQFQSILRSLLYNQDLSQNSINLEIKSVKLHEITNVIEFLVKNGIFEGIIHGNINPIKARELLLLFFINLGRASPEETTSRHAEKPGFFHGILSYIKGLSSRCLRGFSSLIAQLVGALSPQDESSEHLKSLPTQNLTQTTLRNLQIFDVLSLKQGSSYIYLEKSSYAIHAVNSLILKVCFGYFTVEVDSLTDILVDILSSKYKSQLKTESNGVLVFLRKGMFSDGIVSVEIQIISKNSLPELTHHILKLHNDWIASYSSLTYEDFISSKNTIAGDIENQLKYKSIIEFKEEIYLKRYQFNRRKEQAEFIYRLSYPTFLKWLSERSRNAVRLLLVMHSPNSTEEEISMVINATSPDFAVVNSTDYFFSQPNTRSFSPSQTYGLK